MTTVNTIIKICPQCNEKFKTVIVMSYGFKVKTTDLRPIYWGFNPIPLFVSRCPHCYYGDYIDKFKIGDFSYSAEMMTSLEDYEVFRKRRKEELETLKQSAVTNGASERFEVASRLEKEGESPEKIANQYKDAINAIRMNAISPSPFTYPSINTIPIEIDAECAQKYVKVFESSTNPENIIYAYVAAEHFRLAHEFDLALEWYDVYSEAIEDVKDPPVSMDLLQIMIEKAKEGKYEEFYFDKEEEEEGGNLFVKSMHRE